MIKAHSLEKSLSGTHIIKGISLDIKKGEFVSIMGKSGSGKSTLLSLLSGNMKPDSGFVLLDGENITEMKNPEISKIRRQKLGFVYQSLNLISTLTASDNILLPLVLNKSDLKQGKNAMLSLANELGISHLLSKLPQNMSGGERQRVAIARSMIFSPSVIMLDEPTGSLDSKSTLEVMQLLTHLNKTKSVTILQVTHSKEAADFSDRIIEISDGRITNS